MRLLPAILFVVLAAHAAEPASNSVQPLWDSQESVEQYARRANLPPTLTLDLGDGVRLELVLIPAGKFIMGTPEPKDVDEESFLERIEMGIALLAVSGAVLLVLLGTIVVQAFRKWRRPQYSLSRFLAMAVATGAGVLSGMHWGCSERGLAKAQAEYQAALARYRYSKGIEPAHEVTLTRPFYMGKYETTQEQYTEIMGQRPTRFQGGDLPAEMVSLNDAQEFCKRVSVKTGHPLGLPTEAQWEYASRAGTQTAYSSGDGDADLDRVAWHERNSGKTTHPVGQKASNPWGLFDMHGNVCEWCQGNYARYSEESVEDPEDSAKGGCRVLRGGSSVDPPEKCRAASRGYSGPFNGARACLGFRVMVAVPKSP